MFISYHSEICKGQALIDYTILGMRPFFKVNFSKVYSSSKSFADHQHCMFCGLAGSGPLLV